MTQVIVSALYLWLAITAIALVVWVFGRARDQQAAKDARRAKALNSLVEENAAPIIGQKTIDLNAHAAAPAAAPAADAVLQTAGAGSRSMSSGSGSIPSAAGPATMKASAIARAAQLASRRSDAPTTKRPVDIDLTSPLDGQDTATKPRTSAKPRTTTKPRAEAAPAAASTKRSEPAAAATAPVVDDRRNSVEPSKGLADLVVGIKLPHDLMPMISNDPDLAVRAVTLVSTATDAGEIGASFADELERLGYEILSVSDTEAVAKRPAADGGDDDVMSLGIRTNVSDQGSSTIGGSAVAIDLWVGAEESPLPRT